MFSTKSRHLSDAAGGIPDWKKVALCLIGMTMLAAASTSQAANSGNLIVNGDGETGLCTTDWKAVKTVPGWQVLLGNPSLVCYSVANFSKPSSPAAGNAFIADGPYGDSALMQSINVASAAAAIDSGAVTYSLSGWLGGYGIYAGQAIVTATFLDSAGNVLGQPGELSGGTASARGNKNAFVAKSNTGSVPIGTRSIAVQLQFINTSASYNIGYADNLSLTLSTPVATPSLTPPPSTVPQFDHVFFIMMENTDYSEVIGNTANAPYINSLAQAGTQLTNYSGAYHPSDENYMAVAGGDTFVSGAIYFPNIKVTASHIGDRLEAIGKTWKAYEQGMGTPCNTKNNVDSYYQPDDAPFINFTNISGNPTRCAAHLFDTNQLAADLQSTATTPNFSWIAADDYYDGEASGNGSATSVQTQDAWLKQTLQPIFASPAWTN
ncbi:MAG TPA: alkaline phosphatase family protein, partial [Burkholderiaceae bacterium]|nr:alkaline phosphatase family protein [Burkholderiaceae bacterium]